MISERGRDMTTRSDSQCLGVARLAIMSSTWVCGGQRKWSRSFRWSAFTCSRRPTLATLCCGGFRRHVRPLGLTISTVSRRPPGRPAERRQEPSL